MRSGVLFAVAAYSIWGLFPLYFKTLEPAGAAEVLAHRIGWSLVFVMAALALRRRLHGVTSLIRDRRALLILTAAAVLVATNWGIYVYAVTTDRVIEAALGYFISPLVSVGFGLTIFGERLSRPAAGAVLLGTVAVVVLSAYADGFPWIAMVLATSWGSYGVMKKLAGVGAIESLAIETLVLAGPAVAFLLILAGSGEGTFASEGTGHTLLLIASGPVTAIPLALFSAGATRIPLSTAGLLQYLTPVIQFLIGWLVEGESMSTGRWIGFGLVWTALTLLARDGLRAAGAARTQPVVG
jgi:chloramphenicol-sensitive protein RarD